ncbi:MAG TPA: DUF2235 domain-containing protein [Paucimonas sp.]|nr:DUF2235 domain-containing protein [Paucimonas sp.]
MTTAQATSRHRQLIICCDGTDNTLTGGIRDTNVLKLTALLDPDANDQLLFYDPGVGVADQMPATGYWDAFTRKWERLQGISSGKGVYENISSAYEFLVRNYREGDQIFLFGFSRGAFTARCVAGMVNLFGIIRQENVALIGTMINVYFSKREGGRCDKGGKGGEDVKHGKRKHRKRSRHDVAHEIRERFTSRAGRDAWIHFIGVWDTVASVGMPLIGAAITSDGYTTGKRFRHIRHALSLDENRSSFRPRLYWEGNHDDPETGRSLQQLWFRGVHSDVGGGYRGARLAVADECRLSDETLRWMVTEAVGKDLRLARSLDGLVGDPERDRRAVVVHNEALAAPWWGGISRLAVRSQQLPPEAWRTPMPGAVPYRPVQAVAPSATLPAVIKQPGPRAWHQFFVALAAVIVFYVLAAVCGDAALTGKLRPFAASLTDAGWIVERAVAFDAWQRSLWTSFMELYRAPPPAVEGVAGAFGRLGVLPLPPGDPRIAYGAWAIVWDIGLIAAYSWLLGFAGVRLFARRAGLRSVGQSGDYLLFLLGTLPWATVMADLTEDAATLLMYITTSHGLPFLPWLAAIVMACANPVKLVCLGSTLLVFMAARALPAR